MTPSTPPPWIGSYATRAALDAGTEPIRWLATAQGLYEFRTTAIGTFCVPRPDVPLEMAQEGLTLAIPRMPRALLAALVAQFRTALPSEQLAQVYWEPGPGRFVVDIPPQEADGTSVTTPDATDPYDPARPRVLQVHSHAAGPAFFSATDDADEQATGCYGVIGRLDTALPTMVWRLACGGRHVSLRLCDLFAD